MLKHVLLIFLLPAGIGTAVIRELFDNVAEAHRSNVTGNFSSQLVNETVAEDIPRAEKFLDWRYFMKNDESENKILRVLAYAALGSFGVVALFSAVWCCLIFMVCCKCFRNFLNCVSAMRGGKGKKWHTGKRHRHRRHKRFTKDDDMTSLIHTDEGSYTTYNNSSGYMSGRSTDTGSSYTSRKASSDSTKSSYTSSLGRYKGTSGPSSLSGSKSSYTSGPSSQSTGHLKNTTNLPYIGNTTRTHPKQSLAIASIPGKQ